MASDMFINCLCSLVTMKIGPIINFVNTKQNIVQN
jgi:hypothetical protein